MSLGLLIAATTMTAVKGNSGGIASMVTAVLLVSVPLFDAGFRALLRIHRRIPLMTAGPDSLANRLVDELGGARPVAATTFAVQLTVGLTAIAAWALNSFALALVAVAWAVFGVVAALRLQLGVGIMPRRLSAAFISTSGTGDVSSERPG